MQGVGSLLLALKNPEARQEKQQQQAGEEAGGYRRRVGRRAAQGLGFAASGRSGVVLREGETPQQWLNR